VAQTENMETKALRVLIYGPAGTKKTTLAGTFPNPHFVDLDGGMMVLKGKKGVNYVTINGRPTTDPDFISLVGQKFSNQDAFTKAQELIEKWANKLTKEETLVIDSLSFLSNYTMDYVLTTAKVKQARIQDFGAARALIEATLEATKGCECNVVMIAHETFEKDDEQGYMSFMPNTVTKNLATQIPNYFDEVWRSFAEQGKGEARGKTIFGIDTVPTRRTVGKSRINLPARIEEPTYELIMKLKGTGDK